LAAAALEVRLVRTEAMGLIHLLVHYLFAAAADTGREQVVAQPIQAVMATLERMLKAVDIMALLLNLAI
jgi:hypothetical protein